MAKKKDKKLVRKRHQNSKPNRLKDQLQSKLKSLEQDLRHRNRTLDLQNPQELMQSSQMLEDINNLRQQLGLKITGAEDYMAAKQARLEQLQTSENVEMEELVDLYLIPIPKGDAPDTEGQIYHALDLPEIQCRRLAKEPNPRPESPKSCTETPKEQERVTYSSAPIMKVPDVTQIVPIALKRKQEF